MAGVIVGLLLAGGMMWQTREKPDVMPGGYRQTQFFGFGVNTGGSDEAEQCANRTGVGWFGDSLECYLGYEDDEVDVRKRFDVMKEAVETAWRSGNDGDTETLKIFVAPEFFWRGPNGAYDAATILKNDVYNENEFNAISEICEELEDLVGDEKYKDVSIPKVSSHN